MALDVSTLASVRAFAAEYRAAYDGLDVLINNAGVMLNVRGLNVPTDRCVFALTAGNFQTSPSHHTGPRPDGGRAGGDHGHEPPRALPPHAPPLP